MVKNLNAHSCSIGQTRILNKSIQIFIFVQDGLLQLPMPESMHELFWWGRAKQIKLCDSFFILASVCYHSYSIFLLKIIPNLILPKTLIIECCNLNNSFRSFWPLNKDSFKKFTFLPLHNPESPTYNKTLWSYIWGSFSGYSTLGHLRYIPHSDPVPHIIVLCQILKILTPSIQWFIWCIIAYSHSHLIRKVSVSLLHSLHFERLWYVGGKLCLAWFFYELSNSTLFSTKPTIKQ